MFHFIVSLVIGGLLGIAGYVAGAALFGDVWISLLLGLVAFAVGMWLWSWLVTWSGARSARGTAR